VAPGEASIRGGLPLESGAGTNRAPFIIAIVDSSEVEKATNGRRAPRSRIEGGLRGRESREQGEL
jgi:hypothetical protein